MKSINRKHFTRDMIRPAIYMTFTRFLLMLTAALLLNEFIALPPPASMRERAFLFWGVFSGGAAWIAYLRLDGVKLPKLMMRRVNIKKKPTRTYGDLSDYVDEDVVSFEELEDAQKDLCCLIADLFCCIVFLALSLL